MAKKPEGTQVAGGCGVLLMVPVVAWCLLWGPCAGDDDPPAPDRELRAVSKAEFRAAGERWPLKVDHGHVGCASGLYAFFEAPDGARYALNGPAQGRWPKIDAIASDAYVVDLVGRAVAMCADLTEGDPAK